MVRSVLLIRSSHAAHRVLKVWITVSLSWSWDERDSSPSFKRERTSSSELSWSLNREYSV